MRPLTSSRRSGTAARLGRRAGMMLLVALWIGLSFSATLSAADSPAAPFVRLLESGRVPEDRLGPIIDQVCRRGDASDLSYIFRQCLAKDGYADATRQKALECLVYAAGTRKVKPKGDLTAVGALIDGTPHSASAESRQLAVRLVGLWKVSKLERDMEKMATAADSTDALRAAALDSLVSIDRRAAREVIDRLSAAEQPKRQRDLAVATLAQLDLAEAARRAAAILAHVGESEDVQPLLLAIVSRQGGAEQLTTAIQHQGLSADAAKLVMRSLFAAGQSQATLIAALNKFAGISAEIKPPSPAELRQFIADMQSRGDPARGEAIFRRSDVGCMKCHSVSGAGGEIGPDLSPVGASSPPDYLLTSVLLPDLVIKEGYLTMVVETVDGRVLQGIVVDKDNQRIVLKDATGAKTAVPTADIAEQHPGGSLMPKGLANLLTHAELVDLVRFLSELGKPGPFAVRKTQTMQRWRVRAVKADRQENSAAPHAPPGDSAGTAGTADEGDPIYAQVAGTLPLSDIATHVGRKPFDLRGDIDVTVAGEVAVKVNSMQGAQAWIDDKPLRAHVKNLVNLSCGRHSFTLRVDPGPRGGDGVKVEVLRVDGSAAEATTVGGR